MELKTKSLAQERFGTFAASYATSRSHAKGGSLSRLVELAAPEPSWRALDIATGAGHVALALAPRLAHVVAADLTPQMLAVARGLARDRGFANVAFADMRAESLPFPDGTFDLVTCRIAAHHFDDVRQFVAELRAGAAPRRGVRAGRQHLTRSVASIDGDADALAKAAEVYNAFEKRRDPSHVRCLTLSEWRTLVAEAGLRERQVEVLDKPMVFGPWADQQDVPPAAKQELRETLLNGSPALQAFLRPHETNGDIDFMLTEAVIIAVK